MDLLQGISNVAQTGGVGIALVALWIIYKMVTNHTHDFADIVKENSKSSLELAKSLGSQTEVLRSLKETIERKI